MGPDKTLMFLIKERKKEFVFVRSEYVQKVKKFLDEQGISKINKNPMQKYTQYFKPNRQEPYT